MARGGTSGDGERAGRLDVNEGCWDFLKEDELRTAEMDFTK